MSRRDFVLAIVAALGLGLAGCTSMEQYHYMPAYADRACLRSNFRLQYENTSSTSVHQPSTAPSRKNV